MPFATPDSEPGGSPVHVPVLLREVLQLLALEPGQTIVDGTVGAGGHSRQILKRIGDSGILIGLDRDPMMLGFAGTAVAADNCHLRQASYSQLTDVLSELGLQTVDRILLDLGLSSDQLGDSARGFGIQAGGPLDLRFDTSQGRSAAEILATLDEDELVHIFETYGEERFSRAIARLIVQRRRQHPVGTVTELLNVVHAAIPDRFLRDARKQPATRIFQALRIAANDELKHLERALGGPLYEALAPGGRLVVITFHSLEDRIVKNEFRGKDRWQNLTNKPITATPAEQRMNPRCRTAKLRAATKK